MSLRINRMQAGISLIEVMIAMVIVAILLAAGAPSFATFMRNTKIRNAADAVQAGLNRARAEAVRRNTNVQLVLSGTDSSWVLGCVTDAGDIDGDGTNDCPATIETRTAENAASISVSATPSGTVGFNGLGRAYSLAAGTTAVFDITESGGTCIADGGTSRCLRVTVTPGGQVHMCDPGLTDSANPQSCS